MEAFTVALKLMNIWMLLYSIVTDFIDCMCVVCFVLFRNCVDMLWSFIVLVFTYVCVMCSSGQGRTAVADYLEDKYKPVYTVVMVKWFR